jgi:hypothetical protein
MVRYAGLFLSSSLLVTILSAQNQPAPPAEVDEALRARATAFLQSQVDGNFRKAFEYVAEDTKDFYFAAQKNRYLSFKIDSIEYSDNFTKATVKGMTRRTLAAMGRTFDVDLPLADTWKIEDGKWVWYFQAAVDGVMQTPFGTVKMSGTPGDGGQFKPPVDLSPEAVEAAAKKMMSAPSSVNKQSVTFVKGMPASEEIVFHNGAPGVVNLVVEKLYASEAIDVESKEILVKADEDVKVKVTYTPGKDPETNTSVRLRVEPFGRTYVIPVSIADRQAPKAN